MAIVKLRIYHFEGHPEFGRASSDLIAALEQGRFRGIASELTLLELTVRPLTLGRQDAADDYEILLTYFPNLDLKPITREVLKMAPAGYWASEHRCAHPWKSS